MSMMQILHAKNNNSKQENCFAFMKVCTEGPGIV